MVPGHATPFHMGHNCNDTNTVAFLLPKKKKKVRFDFFLKNLSGLFHEQLQEDKTYIHQASSLPRM